jgi:hypothetical protein
MIESHVLGLLKIEGLRCAVFSVSDRISDGASSKYQSHKFHKLDEIINRHLLTGKDIFACQEELIEAGFEEYAKL